MLLQFIVVQEQSLKQQGSEQGKVSKAYIDPSFSIAKLCQTFMKQNQTY